MRLRRPRSWVQWFRRITQGVFLALFLWLLSEARAHENGEPSPLLHVFFDIDPLVLIATWLSTHTLSAVSLLALITLGVTALLGRVFCSWVCPLGTVHHAVGWLAAKLRRNDESRQADGWSPWQRAKYLVLVALIVMAAFGAHWVGVLDPLALLYRSTTTTLLPAAQYAVEDSATAIYVADPHVGPARVSWVTEPAYEFFHDYIFVTDRQTFVGGTVIFVLFVTIILVNFVRNRFWCRYICPLGALLGLFSKRPVMRLERDEGQCTECGRCGMACPAAAQPEKWGQWLPTECYGCWNCVAACNNKGLMFAFRSPFKKPTEAKLDLSKRALLAAGLSGVGGLLMFRLTPQAQARTYNPALIRPPGALPEREFLQHCIQCGLCTKVCPTNALQPTLFEAGIEGLWTPMLVPRIGYCEYECNLCGQVCPSEAIQPLPLEEKKEVNIGLAAFDTTRCLPYAYNRNCIVCEEHCPIPTKAIYFVEKETTLRDGATRMLKEPRVDPDLCNGCGICETVCVFEDRAAIRVTSANETRHPDNQPILPSLPGADSSDSSESFPARGYARPPYADS